jgi:conjugal transfer pilus assembly protein TraE
LKYLLEQSRIQHLISHRNGYLMLASISMLLNMMLFLAIFIIKGSERIVIVPPVIEKPLWVTSSQVSSDYLSEMTLFFANLRLNVTASNAASQRDILLRFVTPENYQDIKTELLLEAERLKKNHVTTAFFPTHIEVDTKKLLAKLAGEMHTTVGNMHLPSKSMSYQIAYRYQHGRLIVTSFDEVKNHA